MKKLFLIFILSVLILTPLLVSAVDENVINPFKGTSMESPIDSAGQLVGNDNSLLIMAIKWMYTILFIVAVGYILWSAYDFVVSQGNDKKVEDAKNKLKYAVIAIAVALLATIASTLVKNSLGGGTSQDSCAICATDPVNPICQTARCSGD